VKQPADVFVGHRHAEEQAIELPQQIEKRVVENAVGPIEEIIVFTLGKNAANLFVVILPIASVEFQESMHVIDRNASNFPKFGRALDRAEEVSAIPCSNIGAED
jgi:hypothetical protein